MKALLILLGLSLTYKKTLLSEHQERNVKFASNVYKKLSESTSNNLLVCPLSLEIVLAMVFTGAQGETAHQISTAASFSNKLDKVVDMFSNLVLQLEGGEEYTFETANKIYVKNSFKIHEQYKDTIVDKFKSDIDKIDFTESNAAATMNAWVEEKTHNKIKNLIDQDNLSNDSRIIILNAMYFNGQWVNGFEENNTKSKPFFLNNTHYVDTDMMSNKGRYKYYQDSELKATFLELPYKGNDVSLVIALPDSPEDITKLESKIESVLQPKFVLQKIVTVNIPKFKLKHTIKFKEILTSLGAVLPFTDAANFYGMLSPEEDGPLKIADIIQKTAIDVDETGTDASAAINAKLELARTIKPADIYFCANHPFIYYIKHKTAGITFVGKYSLPEGEIKIGKYEPPVNC